MTGGLLSSRFFVKRLGLKRTVYMATPLSSVAFLVYFGAGLGLVPSVAFSILGSYLTGVWLATSGALGLLQDETYRGSMMSLNSASSSMDGVLGGFIGGFSLIRFGYLGLGVVTGGLGIVATLLYLLWVRE